MHVRYFMLKEIDARTKPSLATVLSPNVVTPVLSAEPSRNSDVGTRYLRRTQTRSLETNHHLKGVSE